MFDTEAIDSIKDRLTRNQQRVAVAESVTAGLLQTALASAELASRFFEGGITAYNLDQKVNHLAIDRVTGQASNCVSQVTANEMALGVHRMFRCDWGISVTGYATPVPESNFRVFAFFSICLSNRIVHERELQLNGEKALDAQIAYVNLILKEFDKCLIMNS